MNMEIIRANLDYIEKLAPLIAKFRVELKAFKGILPRKIYMPLKQRH